MLVTFWNSVSTPKILWTINVYGSIITSGSGGMGVNLGQYSDLLLGTSGTISTSESAAFGVNADINTVMTINGAISTSGTSGIGIYAADATSLAEQVSILVGGTASIETSGTGAHGISLGDYGDLTLEDGSTITTTNTSTNVSDAAYGIYAQDNTTIDSAADITTSGTYSHGIRLNGTGNVLTMSGDIVTSGSGAHGIFVASATSAANRNSVTVSGDISAGADGIQLGNYGSLTIASGTNIAADDRVLVLGSNTEVVNHGTLDSAGVLAAVFVAGSNVSFFSDGDILGSISEATGTSTSNSYTIGSGGSVTNDSGFAFYLQGILDSSISIEDGASVSAAGTDVAAIYVRTFATIDNAGAITMTGANSYGIQLLGSGSVVTNSGTISTDGEFGHGIYAGAGSSTSYNQIVIEDGGAVETAGDDAYGIWLGDYGTLEIQAGGHVATEGEDAYGVYAGSNTSIVNASTTIATTGDGAHGIVLSGSGNVISQVGAITTEGDGAYGVYATDLTAADTANDISMLTGDFITTKGASAYGIYLGDYTFLVMDNNASIATEGLDSHAVYAGDHTEIALSSSSVSTTGDGSYGISLSGISNIVNSFSSDISTEGDEAIAIHAAEATSAADSNEITLTIGTVSTKGDRSYGVFLDDYAELTVGSGASVLTEGVDAHAVYMTDSATLINNGTIRATGANAVGVYALTNNVITTYGVIAGDDYAIWLAGAGNTVNFMAGMSLVGDVRVDDADNTFVFGEDLNAAITVSGVLPSNVSGEDFLLCDSTYDVEEGITGSCVIVSTDATGFAMLDEMLDDATGPAFEAVGKRLKRRVARGGDAGVGVDEGLMIAPAGDDLGRAPAVWAKSYGSYRDQEAWGDIGSARHGLGGLVSGIDGRLGAGTRAGVLIGATTGSLSAASQDTGWQSLYGGVYAGREVGLTSVVGLTLLAGGAWYDSDRTILDNTSATGRETASADYTAAFVSPELSLSTALSVANLRIAGRYAGLFVGDYEEEGSSSDLAVDARTIHIAGVGATLGVPHAVSAALAVEPYVGLEGRYASSDDVAVEAVSFGQSISLDADGDKTVGRLYAGAGADYASEDGALSVRLSLRGTLDSDGTRAAEASLGGELRF
jgi:hypothetical protein